MHHGRHAGDAAQLDEQHRPQRRLRHPGARVPDNTAVQCLLGGRLAPERRDRCLVLGRPRPPLGERERRPSDRQYEQPDEPFVWTRRGQAVDRRQPHPRQPVPEPRLRDVDDFQRCQRQRQDHGRRLTRSRPDLLQGRAALDAVRDDAGEHLRVSLDRPRRHGLRRVRGRVRPEQEQGREHLRDEVDGRRADVGPVRGRGLADRELAWLLPADELP